MMLLGALMCTTGAIASPVSRISSASVPHGQDIDLSVPALDDDVDTWTQTASSGSFSRADHRTTLKLDHVSDAIVGLSAHPTRPVGTVRAKAFYAAWNSRFGVDPPNAVLASTPSHGATHTTPLTLAHPTYDAADDSMTYLVLDAADGARPREGTFTDATLSIDDSDATASSAAGSAISLVNQVPASVAPMAEFRVSQGAEIGRVGVHAGETAVVPTSTEYKAQATTSMGDFTLTSNIVSFNTASVNLTAQVITENGYYDFQLTEAPGTDPNGIVLENVWRNPVQFTLTRPNSPFQIVTVVDEHNNATISTPQHWQVYAIVNGVTTSTESTMNPSAKFTLVANKDGYTLAVT
jgi:hypothetical protein